MATEGTESTEVKIKKKNQESEMTNRKPKIENRKPRTGTREWSEHSVNIQVGCEHNCRYCYGRFNAVERFGYCASNGAWKNPVINQKAVDANRKKLDGIVMYPTTHDITPLNINEYLCVLRKLLDKGNRVLIVSKPHIECIKVICAAYGEFKEQIEFRFTIGSTINGILKFWEPGAPSFDERWECLKYAFAAGFKTSVSCEPYLDQWPGYLYAACEEYLTDTFWIGKLNGWQSRVDLNGATDEQINDYVTPLMKAQSDEFVMGLVKMMRGRRGVRFKDSIAKVISSQESVVR